MACIIIYLTGSIYLSTTHPILHYPIDSYIYCPSSFPLFFAHISAVHPFSHSPLCSQIHLSHTYTHISAALLNFYLSTYTPSLSYLYRIPYLPLTHSYLSCSPQTSTHSTFTLSLILHSYLSYTPYLLLPLNHQHSYICCPPFLPLAIYLPSTLFSQPY